MSELEKLNFVNPHFWEDYELIDCGGFEKLERFGKFVIRRPEPQAVWNKSLDLREWQNADACFVLDTQNANGEKGRWTLKNKMPEQWNIFYKYSDMKIGFVLRFNSFKHIGIFPEQADNWNFIFNSIRNNDSKDCSVLNLFAYTGGASLAARAAGANVFHIDSVKQVINWANENMQLSGQSNVHWIVEDALKFVKREVRRGNKYNGIIMDPPAFGRGPNGEKWILEKSLNELIENATLLLKEKNAFFILNLYSMGYSSLISETIVRQCFKNINPEYGEMYIPDRFGKNLPLGTYVRFSR